MTEGVDIQVESTTFEISGSVILGEIIETSENESFNIKLARTFWGTLWRCDVESDVVTLISHLVGLVTLRFWYTQKSKPSLTDWQTYQR